jgi:hypothetical protein
MYISIVEIDLPPDEDLAALKNGFDVTAPRYTDVPGLLRKYYTVGTEGRTTGGVFVWDSLAYAKAGHDDPDWRQLIKDKYGTEPRVTFWEVPVVVDNATQLILSGPDYLEASGAATAELLG